MFQESLLAERIKTARLSASLRQEQLAESIDVVVQQISKYENGRDVPTIKRLLRIADVTKKSPAWFFLEPDERIEVGEKTITPKEALAVLAELVEASAAAPTSPDADPAPVESQRERTKSGVFAKKRQAKTSQSGRKAGNQ